MCTVYSIRDIAANRSIISNMVLADLFKVAVIVIRMDTDAIIRWIL